MIEVIESFIGFIFFIIGIGLSIVLFMFLFPNIFEKFLPDEELRYYRREIDRMTFVSEKAKSILYTILSFFIIFAFSFSYVLIFE